MLIQTWKPEQISSITISPNHLMSYSTFLAELEFASSVAFGFMFVTKICRICVLRFHEHALIVAIGLCTIGHSRLIFLLRIVSDSARLLFLLVLFDFGSNEIDVFCTRTKRGRLINGGASTGCLLFFPRQLSVRGERDNSE
jgi:hypothetical protein